MEPVWCGSSQHLASDGYSTGRLSLRELELLLGLLLCYSQLSGVFSSFLSSFGLPLSTVTSLPQGGHLLQGPDPRWMRPISGFLGRDRGPVYSMDEGVGAFGAVLCVVLGLGA